MVENTRNDNHCTNRGDLDSFPILTLLLTLLLLVLLLVLLLLLLLLTLTLLLCDYYTKRVMMWSVVAVRYVVVQY